MTLGLPPIIARLVSLIAEQARSITRSFRRQIDKTGLFPDLKGESGRELRRTVAADGELTKSFMLMSGLSAGIAALGLLQSSTAVVIGAMLISPLMGPIAALGFAFASLDGHRIRDAGRVILLGAVIGILTGMLLTWLSPIRNATPEIIARTEPTLLDLVVAIFSGVAGAYATVWQRGATAIGVAIATALMPPLATVGYGLGVANAQFAMGAFLLFLTNLAAIAFSFALVARMSGAARPLANVEINVRYVAIGIAGFLLLATPLGLTLYRVNQEAKALAATRRVLQSELGLKPAGIAQLEVKWPLRGEPVINAVVVGPDYHDDADARIGKRLQEELGEAPQLNLQQVVATDVFARTRAIVDAAVEQSAAGIARDVPPLAQIRASLDLPVEALWVNRGERTVKVVPVDAAGWVLADYRALEDRVSAAGRGWQVQVIPPAPQNLVVPLRLGEGGAPETGPSLEVALWAVSRWNLGKISVAGFSGDNVGEAEKAQALANAGFVLESLARAGVGGSASVLTNAVLPLGDAEARAGKQDGVVLTIIPPPPRAAETEPAKVD